MCSYLLHTCFQWSVHMYASKEDFALQRDISKLAKSVISEYFIFDSLISRGYHTIGTIAHGFIIHTNIWISFVNIHYPGWLGVLHICLLYWLTSSVNISCRWKPGLICLAQSATFFEHIIWRCLRLFSKFLQILLHVNHFTRW